jgi:uncharacterized protein YjbI with pentapeptide repeats
MAKFSEIEKGLIDKIDDDKLITSLSQLREAAEKIWAPETPRIIKDYTDHGIQHYERIIKYINILLELNVNVKLCSRELYLLVAGVYMHDIGMQCDINLFPEINNIALDLGATYNFELKATSSNEFTYEEQGQIRKNHQYLSAAWIGYAIKTGKTLLGNAAKSIPTELIDDLMDICLYHSKLPISNCPQTFKYEITNRKQFVASILRFADELDIDSSRVSIETVENFRLPPENSIYWYIHNCTFINIKDNLIQILIRLNSNDFKNYGDEIDRIYIKGFEVKNKPVLDILAKNGIALRISNDSKPLEDNYIDKFPDKLVSSLKSLLSIKSEPLNELSSEIKLWLESLNYEVTVIDQNDNDRHILKALLNSGTIRQNVLIHCVNSEISITHVDILEKGLDRSYTCGWVISDTRVSNEARKKTADYISVFNLSEFLTQMVWAPYFDNIRSLTEFDKIEEHYVQPNCYKYRHSTINEETEDIKDSCGSLHEYVENWLIERSKNHLSVLGDFGSGKTWFSKHLTFAKLNEYLKDPISNRLPILITLRDFTKAITPEQLINDALIEKYKLSFIGSAYNIFHELNKRGKILLILDGFDEMANKVDKQTIIDNFWELAKLVDSKSKVILTSRTEYFRWAKESEKILGGEEKGRATLQLSPPKFEVIYLEEFNDLQIRETIVKQLGPAKGEEIAKKVLSIKNLAEMSKKPVLIQLLLSIIEEIDPLILENSSQVYLYATNKLLLRNIDIKRTFTSTKDKVFFLCELAWEMILKNDLNIHYSSIPEIIKSFFGDKIKDNELDHWDFDLRSQTLLHRNVSGFYKFSHKSIAEFFVAFKFAIELGCLLPEYANAYIEKDGKPCELPFCKKTFEELKSTIGILPLTDERLEAVTAFLKNMISSNESHLWNLYSEAKQSNNDINVDFTTQNVLYLLLSIGADFTEKDLSDLHLNNLSFSNTNLINTDFHNSVLTHCSFFAANLQGVNFENTKLIYSSGGFPAVSDVSGNASFVALTNNIIVSLGNSKLYFDNIKDPSLDFTLPLPNKYINSIVSSLDGSTLILTDFDNCYIYDVNNNNEIFTLETKTSYYESVIFDSKNKRFCTFNDDWLSKQFTISVWDIISKNKIMDLEHSYGEIFNACFGTRTDILIAGGRNGILLIFDLIEQKLIKTVTKKALGNPNYIYSISLSPDENFLALGTTNRQLTIIDFNNLMIFETIQNNTDGYYTKVMFSNNGRYLLACGVFGVDVFNVPKWNKIFSTKKFGLAKFTPDSNYVILGMTHWDCDIAIVDLNSLEEIHYISHKLDFSQMNIKGLKAPSLYIDFFVKRGAKGWYTKEDLEKLSELELKEILALMKRTADNSSMLNRKKIIDDILRCVTS